MSGGFCGCCINVTDTYIIVKVFVVVAVVVAAIYLVDFAHPKTKLWIVGFV